MQYLKLVYENDFDGLVEEIEEMKEYFRCKGINIGISESMEEKTHFINISFDGDSLNEKAVNIFNLHISNILYKALVEEFNEKYITEFITETYFFLSLDELKEIRHISINVFKDDGPAINDNSIFYINSKNEIIKKILECVENKEEVNISGFLTFRMKVLRSGLEKIIDKVVEEYLIEKEYNEFIKLLKYFVEIQDSKIDMLNILIKDDGSYGVLDKEGKDIMEDFVKDFMDSRISGSINMEDILISGLITYCPEQIIIHGDKNCKNNEILNTIKNVFINRVYFCEECKMCTDLRNKSDVKR
ncbi:putative sporulation protein YtxC [uncultured Clostridium sp.]|uniref:putative sporulation protein YtxC n=1 Tax=uncultured Clostridium sp. TaxID=59620 RepID=UPI0028E65517|nr:putative sporulation protein YtxC [uncultured Clostridium sp.]